MNCKLDEEKLLRFFTSQTSDKEDSEYVNNLFCEDEKGEELRHVLLKQYYSLLSENDVNKKNLDHILHKIHYNINMIRTESRRSKVMNFMVKLAGIAAVIMIPIAIFWAVKNFISNNPQKETWVSIEAPAWTRAQFCLPDGTTGWLNSNSSLKYFGNYGSDRTVIIDGEAYFDVVTNETNPFRVEANGIELEVTGTKFNISSYQDENEIEVVLDEGKLMIRNNELYNQYTMNPHDLFVYNRDMKTISAQVVDPVKYISWTEGKLSFRNDPIDVVAKRLERWYNVDVVVDGNFPDDLRLRATFVDENLDEVLSLLKRSLPINYRIEKSQMLSDDVYAKKRVIIYKIQD